MYDKVYTEDHGGGSQTQSFCDPIFPHMGAYLGKGPYWQLITLCWLYFGVMFQI